MFEENNQLLVTISLSSVKLLQSNTSTLLQPTPVSSHSVSLTPCSPELVSSPFFPTNSISSNTPQTLTIPSSSELFFDMSPHLILSDSDAEDIILVIDQAPIRSVHSIYTGTNSNEVNTSVAANESKINSSNIRENVAARKFPSPPDAHKRKPIRRHIRYKDQRKFPATKEFFNFLCFSKEKRHEYPKAKKFIFSNVPF
ncbi:hypothetical protein LOD99_9831 [Oopsacas minuta]|uniref:Uncharacterized protein n=1 Tax=Oopsacas minuta TaxID=111878 RepID=A0AAV7KPQ4_9METZ|nr:hypothetical protein LOD99_9831 [Oopsacas minuta]